MTRKRRRLTMLGLAALGLGTASALTLSALGDSVAFFYGPTQLLERQIAPEQRLRLGGLVEAGSVAREGTTVRFRVTDNAAAVPVAYSGVLPDLFREGQGVVAEGRLGADGTFVATEVLAKHDENYMPKEVYEALKAQGAWEGGEPGK